MLVSSDEERIAKVRFWSTQARDKARHYEHSELGYNYRMSNVLAGIGRGQLKVLDRRLIQKKHIFEFYKENLSSLEGLEMMPVNDWNEPNFWLSCITLSGKVKPLEILEALERENIESRPYGSPCTCSPFTGIATFGKRSIPKDLRTRLMFAERHENDGRRPKQGM